MNITSRELNEVRDALEIAEAAKILGTQKFEPEWKQHQQAKKWGSARVGGGAAITALIKVKGSLRMLWLASKGEKILAQADTLDALIEQLLRLELDEETEVTILHV